MVLHSYVVFLNQRFHITQGPLIWPSGFSGIRWPGHSLAQSLELPDNLPWLTQRRAVPAMAFPGFHWENPWEKK